MIFNSPSSDALKGPFVSGSRWLPGCRCRDRRAEKTSGVGIRTAHASRFKVPFLVNMQPSAKTDLALVDRVPRGYVAKVTGASSSACHWQHGPCQPVKTQLARLKLRPSASIPLEAGVTCCCVPRVLRESRRASHSIPQMRWSDVTLGGRVHLGGQMIGPRDQTTGNSCFLGPMSISKSLIRFAGQWPLQHESRTGSWTEYNRNVLQGLGVLRRPV